MSENTNARERELLGEFYRRLRSAMSLKSGNSVLVNILSKRKVDVAKIFAETSLTKTKHKLEIIYTLEKKGFISNVSDDINKCMITAHGVYEHEFHKGILNIDDLIAGINHEYVSSSVKAIQLSSKNAVILFLFIGCRFFSNECYLELGPMGDETINKYFIKLLKETKEFLADNNLINQKALPVGKGKNQATHIMARTDTLKKATNYIFENTPNTRRHWLNLNNDKGKVDGQKLSHLLKVLFTNKLNDSKKIYDARAYLISLIDKRYMISNFDQFYDFETTTALSNTFDKRFLNGT